MTDETMQPTPAISDEISSDEPPPPPMTPRRRKLPVLTMALGIAAAIGVGFVAGVQVEKHDITPAAASRATANTAGSASLPSTAPSAGVGRFGGEAGGGNGSGATTLVGTISMVNGTTLYITQTATGNTVKVTTTTGTTVTRTVTGTVHDLSPGQTVIIRGVQTSNGVYAAQSIAQSNGAFAGGFGGFGGFGRGGRRGGATPSPSASAG